MIDELAGIERGATLAMRYADLAVVVTNPEVSSVRDSDRIIGLLDSKTEKAEKASKTTAAVTTTTPAAAAAAAEAGEPVEKLLGPFRWRKREPVATALGQLIKVGLAKRRYPSLHITDRAKVKLLAELG